MDDATLDAWNRGAYARCLRDAQASIEAMADNARLLWASVFGAAETWFDPEPIDYRTRPTECEAISGIFRQARGASNLWAEWQTAREAALYGSTLEVLADNLPHAAEMTEQEERRRRAMTERKAIKASQMSLPAPFALAG